MLLADRMKNTLDDFWFPYDYNDILDYTTVDYRYESSYEDDYIPKVISQPKTQDCHPRNYCNKIQVQALREEIDFRVEANFWITYRKDWNKNQVLPSQVEIFYEDILHENDFEVKDEKVNVLEKFDEGYSGAKFCEAKL